MISKKFIVNLKKTKYLWKGEHDNLNSCKS